MKISLQNRYEFAFEEDQKYKEGRFILEEELCSSIF